MDETLVDLGEHIAGELAEYGVATSIAHGELTVTVDARHIVQVLRFLRDDPSCRFACFIDICGVDYPAREMRFDVVYHLLSPSG
jgi:NADH-quinone oxidoreductase subunit C